MNVTPPDPRHWTAPENWDYSWDLCEHRYAAWERDLREQCRDEAYWNPREIKLWFIEDEAPGVAAETVAVDVVDDSTEEAPPATAPASWTESVFGSWLGT